MKTILEGPMVASVWATYITCKKAWSQFWFSSPSLPQVRAFRSVLGVLLFAYFATRSLDLDVFYTDHGILTLAYREELLASAPGSYSLLTYFTSSTMLWVFHLSFLISLLTMAFGIFPRFSAFIASVLHISFLHRNMMVAYGADALSTFFLIYLCFADGYAGPKRLRSYLSSIAFRFAQIQICIVYGYSGLMKLSGSHWWSGEAIWDVLTNYQLARWDFSWIGSFPVVIILCTYSTILWEIYFPVLVWMKPLRPVVLLGGVLLHFGIGLTMNIPFFAGVMVSSYILFLNNSEIERATSWVAGWVTGPLRFAGASKSIKS